MFSIGYYLRILYTYICNKKQLFLVFVLSFCLFLHFSICLRKSFTYFAFSECFWKLLACSENWCFFPNTIISLIIIKTKLKTYNKSVQLKCHIKYKTTYFIIKSQRWVIYRTFCLQPQNQIVNKIHDYISYMEYTTPLKAYLLHKLKGNLQPSCC